MIEINLLPQELKSRIKDSEATPPLFVYFIPLVFLLLILVHAVLGLVHISRSLQFNSLTQDWSKFEAQRKQLETFKQQANLVSRDLQSIQGLISQRVDWSEKLSILSQELPIGVWFTELTLRGTEFVLKGSVVSLKKMEVPIINKFVDDLKKDARFSKDFSNFTLGPFTRRAVGNYEAVDFILNGTLNK